MEMERESQIESVVLCDKLCEQQKEEFGMKIPSKTQIRLVHCVCVCVCSLLTSVDSIASPDECCWVSGFDDGPQVVLSRLVVARAKGDAVGLSFS